MKGNAMKYLVMLIIFFSLFVEAAYPQTEIWRVQGGVAVQDNSGNTYVSKSFGADQDSLSKIDSMGEILWTVPLPTKYYRLLWGNNGIYVTPKLYGDDNNTVYFYNTSGILIWSHTLAGSGFMKTFPEVDQLGNIVIAYNTTNNSSSLKLLKLNSNGEQVFEISIPTIVSNAYEHSLRGPAIASNGNIWVVVQATTQAEKQRGNSFSIKQVGYEAALLFDGVTGALLLQKNIYQGLTDEQVDDGRGNLKEYTSNAYNVGGPSFFVLCNGNNLIAGGYFTFLSTKCRSNGSCKSVQKSEWRMSLVDPTGKLSRFRYRGKGEYRSIYGTEYSTVDDDGNELEKIISGETNDLFLHGRVARGKTMNGIGDYFTDDVVLRFSLTTKKIDWKIATQMPSFGETISTYVYQPSQLILRQKDARTIEVYNNNGVLNETQLIFPYDISLPPQSGIEYRVDNTESGFLLLSGYSCDILPCERFIAKFSIAGFLATQNFTRHIAIQEDYAPEQFSLAQNYPNPFNPTTTIDFELAGNALVTLKVYNTLGQEIITLADKEEFFEGANSLEFNASGLPSGIYYYRIVAEGLDGEPVQFAEMKKMVLMK